MSSYRKRRLFPRSLAEVVKDATGPMLKQQGKFYTALLRDWPTIVGPERAAFMKPLRVQFPKQEGEGATLHLTVSAEKAPEVAYMEQQLIEQLARYFGYKAVARIVLHPSHEKLAATLKSAEAPRDLKAVYERMQRYFAQKPPDKRT